MITLDEVADRCRIEDGDDCKIHWTWLGASFKGAPRIHAPNFTLDPTGRTLTTQNGRRAVWHIKTGKAIPNGWRTWSKCHVMGCVNPECIGAGGLKAYGLAVQKSGKYQGVMARILANRRNSGLQRKVTRAVADDILGSNETNIALAARHGLHRETVSRVKRGLGHVPGNVFQGLIT